MPRVRSSARVTAIILAAACLQLVPLVRPAPSTFADHPATGREGDEVRATDVEVLLPDEPPHVTANVRVADLIGDGSPQVFVTEPLRGHVAWLRGLGEPILLSEGLVQPLRIQVVDINGDGDRDLLVADIGLLQPTDDKVGRVVLLRNRGAFDFEPQVLLEGVGRVACAEAADLDGDGDLDIAVCVFGDVTGKVLWLEQKDGFTFEEHVLDPQPGSIHAFPFDADADGDLDLAVALSQDSEQVLLFRNGGRGDFASEVLFDAGVPYYGTSGIELSDLDQDGDTDILYTNGDEGDGPLPDGLDPYEVHGLAWFENDGSGHFAVHDILRHWGAYSVRGFDIDGDLDTDLVLSAVQVPGRYTDVVIRELVWLENDGQQGFTARYVAGAPPRLITIEAADLDGDGKAEVLGGSFNECGIVASEEELGTSCPTVGHRLATFSISADAPAKLELPASGDASVRLLLGALFAAGAGLAFGGLALIRRSDRSGGKRRRLPRHV